MITETRFDCRQTMPGGRSLILSRHVAAARAYQTSLKFIKSLDLSRVGAPMTNDQSATLSQRKIKGGGNRAYILYRLRKMGCAKLAEQVINHEISAMQAAVLCGIAARRQWLRKGQRIVDEAEWQKLLKRVQIAEDGWPQRAPRAAAPQSVKSEPTRKKIDVAALIG